MFHISASPAPRKAASALSVLAAMGAAGMASQATAAVATIEPALMVKNSSDSYGYMAANWVDEIANDGQFGADAGGRTFVNWNIDWPNIGTITNAQFTIEKNLNSSYSIPAGTSIDFALITEAWDTTAGENRVPPIFWTTGPSTAAPIAAIAPEDIIFTADVTSLLTTWQANPTAYFGIMFHATTGDPYLGVIGPAGGVTGDLVLTTVPIPEPASLGLLALGGLLALRRRR